MNLERGADLGRSRFVSFRIDERDQRVPFRFSCFRIQKMISIRVFRSFSETFSFSNRVLRVSAAFECHRFFSALHDLFPNCFTVHLMFCNYIGEEITRWFQFSGFGKKISTTHVPASFSSPDLSMKISTFSKNCPYDFVFFLR